MASDERSIVVKVGGSLFDLPGLVKRLRAWVRQLNARKVLIVPGGGLAADAVRLFDRVQQLGEETAHWCALQALELHSTMLHYEMPEAEPAYNSGRIVEQFGVANQIQIVYPLAFIRSDEQNIDHLPHSWDVSSDSVAARIAIVGKARKLILLKSVTIQPGMTWIEASQRGYVDRYFPTAIAKAGDLEVEAVNFRQWEPPT